MELQQLFDKVCSAMIRQGCQAITGTRACVYYDPDTKRRCAIGLILSEESAKELAENSFGSLPPWIIRNGIYKKLKEIGVETETEYKLLQDLQKVHDNWMPGSDTNKEFIEYFIKEAEHIATKRGLSIEVLRRSH